MRAFGIPATLDYTPHISDTNQGFAWAVAMNKNAEFVPLLPPGTEDLFLSSGRIPKVYRRIFHDNENSLFAKKNLEVTTPPFIGHYHYQDVTQEYFATRKLCSILHAPTHWFTLPFGTMMNGKLLIGLIVAIVRHTFNNWQQDQC